MHEIIEQIETCELKATEWRAAMRLLHQADVMGRVQLTRAECIALCQVTIWGAAARLLRALAKTGLIDWHSRQGLVTIHFLGWHLERGYAKASPCAQALSFEEASPVQRSAVSERGDLISASAFRAVAADNAIGLTAMAHQIGELVSALTEVTRQNSAILALLVTQTRQTGAFAPSTSAVDTELPRAYEKGVHSPTSSPTARQGSEISPTSGLPTHEDCALTGSSRCQNCAQRAEAARERVGQDSEFSHTRTRRRAQSVGRSVDPLSTPRAPEPPTDRQTDLKLRAEGLTNHANAHGTAFGESSPLVIEMHAQDSSQRQPQQPFFAALPLTPIDVEPELALGLLTSREVGLPLRDAEVVAYKHPFWRIRDCVFYYLNCREEKHFRSPRIMLTWLARWDEFVVPATAEADAQTDLYQRYLLPTERQAKAEAEAAADESPPIDEPAASELAVKERAIAPAPPAVMSESDAVWQTALWDLALQMPAASYHTWMQGTWVVAVEEDVWRIGVPNPYALDWLNSRLRAKSARLLARLVNQPVTVSFEVVKSAALEKA